MDDVMKFYKENNMYPWLHPNIVIPPEADARDLFTYIVMIIKNSPKKRLKFQLLGYPNKNVFFNTIISELKQLFEDRPVQQELAHCDRIEVCGTYPEQGFINVWGR